jgi:hypothetical protein
MLKLQRKHIERGKLERKISGHFENYSSAGSAASFMPAKLGGSLTFFFF